MYPILGRYGPFFLYSFTVVIGLGLFAGIGISAWQARQNRQPGWLDALLASLAVGLIGGRAGFVLSQWGYFQERANEIWQVWHGGLSYHGALLAGMFGLWAWCARRGRRFEAYAGLLSPGFALATGFGWLACWLEGCAYGREGAIGPLTAALPDTFGVFAVRYQTQLMGMVLSLVVLLIGLWGQQRWSALKLFSFTLLGLSASRMVITFFRGDAIFQLGPFRGDSVIDAALTLAFLILLQYGSRKRKRHSISVEPLPATAEAGQTKSHEGRDET